MDDALWPHFLPLWLDLDAITSPNILIAGGYGLFLKQQWLTLNSRIPTVVPLENWLDVNPRVTKDVDLVLGLDLIQNKNLQESVILALEKNDFKVSEKPSEQRWKFIKHLEGGQEVIVEMHAQLPEVDAVGIKTTGKRVKHKPSLGDQGVHGRTNSEAVGSELHPFHFSLYDINLIVPNPVTWCVMKLTATSDRWALSQDEQIDPKIRELSREHATKHAQDVYRVVAMMTREERDRSREVVDSIIETDAFKMAAQNWRNLFLEKPIPLVFQTEANWQANDAATVRELLAGWFG